MKATPKHATRRESSARYGWLSLFLDDDRRRLVLAVALAIALEESAFSMLPSHRAVIPPAPTETITIAKIVRIEHRPRPTPAPTPKPTPRPVVHTKTIAETHVKPHIVNPGNPSQKQRIRRIASARPIAHTKYHSKPATIHVPTGGHGVGTSKTAKAETGGIGPGGTGTGESGTGAGTGGAPAANEPCGYVDFEPNSNAVVDSATGRVWEHITMVVHFPDGSSESTDLDYPWYYPSSNADPWSQYNLQHDPNGEVPFQFPPDTQRAAEPNLVQYVIRHTTPEGLTLLRACPK